MDLHPQARRDAAGFAKGRVAEHGAMIHHHFFQETIMRSEVSVTFKNQAPVRIELHDAEPMPSGRGRLPARRRPWAGLWSLLT